MGVITAGQFLVHPFTYPHVLFVEGVLSGRCYVSWIKTHGAEHDVIAVDRCALEAVGWQEATDAEVVADSGYNEERRARHAMVQAQAQS